MADPVPTEEQVAAMALAVIYKAARFLMLPNSPLGAWGEFGDGGVAVVSLKPDYAIQEMLLGLHFQNWAVDLTQEVSTADVIRVGLETDPGSFPADKLPDVQRAIDASIHWVAQDLLGGVGVG